MQALQSSDRQGRTRQHFLTNRPGRRDANKPATDAPIALEVSPDLLNWSSVATTQSLDLGLTETLTHQETASAPAKFFRLKCSLQ
jgi:hypothetical protein